MSIAVVCLVSDILKADAIVNSLKMAGFESREISLLMPDTRGVHDVGYEKHTKVAQGMAVGGTCGMILGGVLGYFIGSGTIALPAMGAFIAAGPMLAALSGAAVCCAVMALLGGLIGMTQPSYRAVQYDGKLGNGQNIFISVHTTNNEQQKKAEQIFKLANAHDINHVREERAAFKRAA